MSEVSDKEITTVLTKDAVITAIKYIEQEKESKRLPVGMCWCLTLGILGLNYETLSTGNRDDKLLFGVYKQVEEDPFFNTFNPEPYSDFFPYWFGVDDWDSRIELLKDIHSTMVKHGLE